MRQLRILLGFLASMRFGLLLFGATALVSALGSFMPVLGEALYGSWGFAAILLALVLNTGLCTARQLGRLRGAGGRASALFAVHASVLLLSLACAWAALSFRGASLSVAEGESFAVDGQTWRLLKVEVRRYPDGAVSDWVSTVGTPAGVRDIRVNHPAVSGDEKVLQAGYSRVYRARLEAGGLGRELEIAQDAGIPLTADGSVGFALSPPQAGLLAGAGQPEGAPPLVDLLLSAKGRVVQRVALFENLPLEIGDTGLRLTVRGSTQRSVFLVRHAPGLPLVWAGFALLALSVTVLMLMPRPAAKETDDA
jgi:hypothetical protein